MNGTDKLWVLLTAEMIDIWRNGQLPKVNQDCDLPKSQPLCEIIKKSKII